MIEVALDLGVGKNQLAVLIVQSAVEPGRVRADVSNRHIAIFLVLASCCSSVVFGQVAETPRPPGRLPQLISECESGPNYLACSLWIWRGSAYSAIWQNGAFGQLTVTSTDPENASFARQDSAGPVAGLKATYTAKWDGSTFTGGKIVAKLAGATNTLTWTGAVTVTPVLPTPLQDGSYLNWYPGQLTAYARFGSQSATGQAIETQVDDFRLANESPMSPGESRLFPSGRYAFGPNYEQGAHYPARSVIAAIYADGATFGDARVLKVMLQRRKEMLASLNAIGPLLCSMGQQGASLDDISAALNKQQAAEKRQGTAVTDGAYEAYLYVQRSVNSRVNHHLSLTQAMKRTWDDFNKLRSGVSADPVKDAGGAPVIPATLPLTCNLP